MAYITGENRKQITLFMEAVDDYITSDNPVRVIEAFVDSLDMQELGFQRAEPKQTARRPYDPRDLSQSNPVLSEPSMLARYKVFITTGIPHPLRQSFGT